MSFTTVIFDMDGLMIDSEPLWNDASFEVFKGYGINSDKKLFSETTGLRTREFLKHWFDHFKLDTEYLLSAEEKIIDLMKQKVLQSGKVQPGLSHILNFFIERKFKIGLASSSPMSLIKITIDYLGVGKAFSAFSSAADLEYGKPHPAVYMDCAKKLNAEMSECLAFEDSFNGLIAAKAARMKCVVVPAAAQFYDPVWNAADLKIASLQNFNDLLMSTL